MKTYEFVTFQQTVRDPKVGGGDESTFMAPPADGQRASARSGYTIQRDGDTIYISHPQAPGRVMEYPWALVKSALYVEPEPKAARASKLRPAETKEASP